MVILAAFHFFVSVCGLYETTTWVDIISHFLGGVVVGFGVLWLLVAAMSFGYTVTSREVIPVVIAGVLVVAGAWEVFEYFAEALREPNYVLDTVVDLVVGTLGAVFAWALARKNMLV